MEPAHRQRPRPSRRGAAAAAPHGVDSSRDPPLVSRPRRLSRLPRTHPGQGSPRRELRESGGHDWSRPEITRSRSSGHAIASWGSSQRTPRPASGVYGVDIWYQTSRPVHERLVAVGEALRYVERAAVRSCELDGDPAQLKRLASRVADRRSRPRWRRGCTGRACPRRTAASLVVQAAERSSALVVGDARLRRPSRRARVPRRRRARTHAGEEPTLVLYAARVRSRTRLGGVSRRRSSPTAGPARRRSSSLPSSSSSRSRFRRV